MTLKIWSRSPNPNQFYALSQWCIHANLIRIQPLVALHYDLKIRSRSPNPNQSFLYRSLWICKSPTTGSQDIALTRKLPKTGSSSATVTLKIRSRSPKPNQFFALSQRCIHANLIRNANTNTKICTKNKMSPSPLMYGHNKKTMIVLITPLGPRVIIWTKKYRCKLFWVFYVFVNTDFVSLFTQKNAFKRLFKIHGHVSYLHQQTGTIWTFFFLLLMLQVKFGCSWPDIFREDTVWKCEFMWQ